jgi:hypothetical protein
MLKVKVGTKIRSYDFAGNLDCYLEGVVTDIKDGLFHCATTKVVWDDEELEATSPDFRTPELGNMWNEEMFELGRIELI